MRDVVYDFAKSGAAAPEEPTEVTRQSFDQSIVADLSSELARPVKPAPRAEEPKKEDPKKAKPGAEPEPEETARVSSARVAEDVEKLRGKIAETIKVTIVDPKRAAKSALKLFNIIRILVYPWIYKKILFEGKELEEIDKVLVKIADNRRAGHADLTTGLDGNEKYLWGEWEGYQTMRKNVLWTPDEVELIAEVGHLQMMEIKALRWLMEHEFMLVIIVIEGRRFGPVIGKKMGLKTEDMTDLLGFL